MKKAEKKIPSTPETRHIKKVTVTAIRLAVRKEPSLDAEIVKIVSMGDELEMIGDGTEAWTKVRGGYVMSEFVS